MKFAERTEFLPETSGFQATTEAARSSGVSLLDLTVTNPTRCGFAYDEALLGALLNQEALRYDADALGMLSARKAVAEAYYGQRGAAVSPDSILLTASTSEAYGYLLRLLCNPGDQVLVPQPSYPLFDLLARMHDVDLMPYPLVYHDGWQIDAAGLEGAVTARTRAIIVVHPNNPTGHYAGDRDREVLRDVATRHDLALIVDEVFLDYPVQPREKPVSFASEPSPVLCFVLSGISKVLALPQMKLAWTVVCGPEELRGQAMDRLEIITDTFLSVGAPVQLALEPWLRTCLTMQQQIRERVRKNLAAADEVFRRHPLLSRLPVEGGWSLVLRTPALERDLELAVQLMEQRHIAVHPGSFYGFGERGWLVVSLLTPEEVFLAGVSGLVSWIDEVANAESE